MTYKELIEKNARLKLEKERNAKLEEQKKLAEQKKIQEKKTKEKNNSKKPKKKINMVIEDTVEKEAEIAEEQPVTILEDLEDF